jgi:hypothetical protein
MKTTTFRLKNPRPPSGHVLFSCTLLRLVVVAVSETIVAAIFNRSRVLGVGAVCLQHGGWSAGCHVRGENVNVCVCVCCVLCIRSRSRSGRRAPGPRPRVTSPTITDGDEVQSPTDLKVTLPTDNNRNRIGESVGTDLDAHSTTERTPIRNVPDEANFFPNSERLNFNFSRN